MFLWSSDLLIFSISSARCVCVFLCYSQTKNVELKELVYSHLGDSGQFNVYFFPCRVNSFAVHEALLTKSKHATPIRQYKFVRPRTVNRNWEWRGTPNNWKHALKSKHNLWNTRKRLRKCKNWWIQIKTPPYGRSCFISNLTPSGPWERDVSVFSFLKSMSLYFLFLYLPRTWKGGVTWNDNSTTCSGCYFLQPHGPSPFANPSDLLPGACTEF